MLQTKDLIAAIHERMERYRRVARAVWDQETAAVLKHLADELEAVADRLEQGRPPRN